MAAFADLEYCFDNTDNFWHRWHSLYDIGNQISSCIHVLRLPSVTVFHEKEQLQKGQVPFSQPHEQTWLPHFKFLYVKCPHRWTFCIFNTLEMKYDPLLKKTNIPGELTSPPQVVDLVLKPKWVTRWIVFFLYSCHPLVHLNFHVVPTHPFLLSLRHRNATSAASLLR